MWLNFPDFCFYISYWLLWCMDFLNSEPYHHLCFYHYLCVVWLILKCCVNIVFVYAFFSSFEWQAHLRLVIGGRETLSFSMDLVLIVFTSASVNPKSSNYFTIYMIIIKSMKCIEKYCCIDSTKLQGVIFK